MYLHQNISLKIGIIVYLQVNCFGNFFFCLSDSASLNDQISTEQILQTNDEVNLQALLGEMM